MALGDLNRATLIGRLTRDPEVKAFQGGGKVANFSLAFAGSSKKNSSGEWEDIPCFLECKAFNSERGRKLADVVESYLKKGSRVYLEGRLTLEQWEDKNGGGKRSQIRLAVDNLILLDKKQDSGGSGSGGGRRQEQEDHSGGGDDGGDIPF